jgi:hypothetical protein
VTWFRRGGQRVDGKHSLDEAAEAFVKVTEKQGDPKDYRTDLYRPVDIEKDGSTWRAYVRLSLRVIWWGKIR